MKGEEKKLEAFLQGCDKRFIIPVYQRNYDWKIEQCRQLYNDLIKTVKEKKTSHFFGSIVSYSDDSNNYIIIDGQQRLTTITILLLALHHIINGAKIPLHDDSLKTKIYEEYLTDRFKKNEEKIKLKPIKKDQKALCKLFEEEQDELISSSNITINYSYFYSRILQQEISADELYDAIRKLEIINVTLNKDDDPQLIFECLNSTGLALSEGDKIRNYVLMDIKPIEKQEDYYNNYWSKIETNTDFKVSYFIRDYLSVKSNKTPPFSRIYQAFKEYVEKESTDIQPILQDMLNYSKRYNKLLKGSTNVRAIDACIDRLNRLETTVTRPFFLEALRLFEDKIITEEDLSGIFSLTESYLFRRSICEIPTNSLNKIFLYLNNDIYRFEKNYNNYFEKFKYVLTVKRDSSRFPTDKEFQEHLSTRPIFQMSYKNKIYILERYENNDTLEDKDIYRHCDEGTYSIEHIMPQTLSKKWKDDLGENYRTIHENWLHRLANLTLTAYNSKYSNARFIEKRDMEHGFKQSGLRLNNSIKDLDKWTEKELIDRDHEMTKEAIKIWKYPETSYTPQQKISEIAALDDEDVSLSGKQINSFEFKGVETKVKNWLDMFETVIKQLHTEDKSVLNQLADADPNEGDLATIVSRDPKKLRASVEIDTSLFIEKNTSTERKVSLLRKLFKMYNVQENDLIFYLNDEKSSN